MGDYPLLVVRAAGSHRWSFHFFFCSTPSILYDTMSSYSPSKDPSLEDLAHSVKSHVPMMFGNMLAFHIVATLCMCLRFYSKRVSRAKYFPDDYVLIASWVRLQFHLDECQLVNR